MTCYFYMYNNYIIIYFDFADPTDSSDDGTDAFFDIRAIEQGMTLGMFS